tara:strand:+ start:762 stop:2261 length:1500 start_codon:yes stop_codon:yes gene_type:complete
MESPSIIIDNYDKQGLELLERIKSDFIGLDTEYTTVDGKQSRRVYLDSTASTLMMGPAYRAATKFLAHYSNTHSLMHFSAKISTKTYEWVHSRVLDFVGADPDIYTCFFTGSGVTAGMNRIARCMKSFNPDKDTVLVSLMEHHSNDLPHRKHGGNVFHIPLDQADSRLGSIDLDNLEKYFIKFKNKINYVAVTGISNVTGIINPINEVAKIAHRYGAYVIVDAAQLAAHVPIKMYGHEDKNQNIDALLFSGHKTYAPGSPGAVIVRKDIMESMEPQEVGGGMVDRVFPESYIVSSQFPDREEAGTPNIFGAIVLGASIEILDRIGMQNILEEDKEITNYALESMLKIEDIIVYGSPNISRSPRAGTISFNILGMNHGLVAAILNDYFNIAVRNECFCAHPYVEKMLEMTHLDQMNKTKKISSKWNAEPWMGMVRASFGIYTSKEDINYFISSLSEISSKKDFFSSNYSLHPNGDYIHNTFKFSCNDYFTLSDTVLDEVE